MVEQTNTKDDRNTVIQKIAKFKAKIPEVSNHDMRVHTQLDKFTVEFNYVRSAIEKWLAKDLTKNGIGAINANLVAAHMT